MQGVEQNEEGLQKKVAEQEVVLERQQAELQAENNRIKEL